MRGRREWRVESQRLARGAEQPCHPSRVTCHSPAFTLLEVMMVVAIIGLMMAMGVPAILKSLHEEPMRKAVNDVMNICSHARAQAILNGQPTTVIFHPRLGEMALAGIASTNATGNLSPPDTPSGKAAGDVPGASALNSTQFGNGVIIDMLDVNLTEYKDADEAQVRFFPNGTSDELTLILHYGDQYEKISLEVTTALASLEVIH